MGIRYIGECKRCWRTCSWMNEEGYCPECAEDPNKPLGILTTLIRLGHEIAYAVIAITLVTFFVKWVWRMICAMSS